jgi:lipopolysaccharide/colanic/teichoic acid biosynthesis glycosyltransferase
MSMSVKGKKQLSRRKKTHPYHPPEGHVRAAANVQRSPYFATKERVERIAAAILLLPGIPLIGLLIVIVRLHSRGPGIYRQMRLGKSGRVFEMYKIRTMRHDAERKTGPVWAKHHDVRITSLGRFLRKVHLDELPQLINVVKNEMSLIGPRPERPEIAAALVKSIPNYADRLAVHPGITGLAQINLPPDLTVEDVRRKLVLDMKYVREASLWLDVRIFMSTFVRLLGLPGTWAMTLFGLRCPEVHDNCIAAAHSQDDEEAFATADDAGNGRSHDAADGHGRCEGNGSASTARPRVVDKPR